jgi:hypothetical protein
VGFEQDKKGRMSANVKVIPRPWHEKW